jgi:ssDNA-binding Zn-finger/Zn-ribbon topoisomerase 1
MNNPTDYMNEQIIQIEGDECYMYEEEDDYIGRYLGKEKLCPLCKGPTHLVKNGKHGPFYGCDRYPKCKSSIGDYFKITSCKTLKPSQIIMISRFMDGPIGMVEFMLVEDGKATKFVMTMEALNATLYPPKG